MPTNRLFLDTDFVQALLNPRDSQHSRALNLLPRITDAAEVVTTEAVLVEIGNGLSATQQQRQIAAAFIRRCYTETNITVLSVDTSHFTQALELYATRTDKAWGLTDCISFVVMREHGLTDAATGDRHFRQAGFRALMAGSDA